MASVSCARAATPLASVIERISDLCGGSIFGADYWDHVQYAMCQAAIHYTKPRGKPCELTAGGGLISVTTIVTPESGLESSAETGGPSIPLPP